MAARSLVVADFKKDIPGHTTADLLTYEFPPIFSKNSRGNEMTWQIIVKLFDGSGSNIKIKDDFYSGALPSGVVAKTTVLSKLKSSANYTKKTPTITKSGKNIGRANETNAFTQALRDALGKYNKQLAKSSALDCYPPMLVQNRSPPFYKNLYVQRKLDGVRCIAYMKDDAVILYSRTCKEFYHLDYLREEIKTALRSTPGLFLDGELYKHGISLQDISGITRTILKKDTGGAPLPKLDYYIYDCFDPARPKLSFKERLAILKALPPFIGNLRLLETVQVQNKAEVDALFKKYLSEGYEGAILRLPDAPYKYSYNGYHSSNIFKMKLVYEDEFKIVDITEGTYGKAKGAVIFIVETKEGKRFNVTPGLPLKQRYELFKSGAAKKYIGKRLTIKYDALSKDEIPLRARTDGLVIRDYE